jgi:N-acetylmuramoyl-L-alanine amidase
MKQYLLSNSRNFFLILTIIYLAVSPVGAFNYVNVTIKNGDGMYQLFRKYNIPANTCNINQFKQINKLSNLNLLLVGKTYHLPIALVPFNGKSVTTSVKGVNKDVVIRIINYNKFAYSNRLRKAPYVQSKFVWVLHHEIGCSKSPVGQINKPAAVLVKTKISSKESTGKSNYPTSGNSAIKEINSKPERVVPATSETTAETGTLNEISSAGLRTKSVPIFGSDFKEIRIQDEVLKNKVYYLVSGHGGPDPGTIYRGQNMMLCEDEYAYDVTLRLARKLMEHGATVHMIVQDPNDGIRNEMYLDIDKDEKCITGYPLVLNQRLRLTQTTDAVNDLYRTHRKKGIADQNQLAVHIHVDSQHKDTRKDVYFYYQDENKTSEAIAKRIQKTLDNKYKDLAGRSYNGTVSTRNLFVMRNTIPSTIFMELGNIQNTLDHKRLLISSNRQALAEWLYDGLTGE